MSIGILTCSALTVYVRAAQEKMKTEYPIVEIDRNYHDRPRLLRNLIEEGLSEFPAEIDTILVAMGACGNCWEGLSCTKKLVIPRMDDCVTILLHTDDEWHPNLKKPGHFYQIDEENDHFSMTAIYERTAARHGERRAKRICDTMFGNYTNMDIVDTGVFDCHEQKFVARMQKDADFIRVPLGYVKGSNLILEKLVSGKWDEQFIVIEAGTEVSGDSFLTAHHI